MIQHHIRGQYKSGKSYIAVFDRLTGHQVGSFLDSGEAYGLLGPNPRHRWERVYY